MATKSKLEQAVEEQVSSLGEAQKELVLSQLSVYKSNRARMSDVSSRIDALGSMRVATREDVRFQQAERSTLSYEYNQLATANSRIATELFEILGRR